MPYETPGAVERAERLARRRRNGLSHLQRGLFGDRRRGRHPRAALRGSDPAGASAAAAVPERAGDHGPDGAAAPPTRPGAGAARRGRRDRAAGRPGPQPVEPRHDRRRAGADRQGAPPPAAGPLPDAGGDRRVHAHAARPRTPTGRRSTSSTPRSSACSPRRWSPSTARWRSQKCMARRRRSA